MQYTKEDLKGLSNFLGGEIEALPEVTVKADRDALRSLQKQLDVIKYSPLLLQSMLEMYDVDYVVLECPIDEMVLHMNHGGVVVKAICKWRFNKGV
jgi:hypothetical protein